MYLKGYLHHRILIFAAIVGFTFTLGCNQISSSDESIRENRAATITANVAATLSSTTLNPTLISESVDVQASMILWMAESGEWPEALDEPTDDLTSTDPALSPTYLTETKLACSYSWDSQGHVEQYC
ncbi:MAG: hypothetical protein O2974_01750 [Chloroflexi bacterium]|nr:hypothetical protein [Chloroflexota bacterium]